MPSELRSTPNSEVRQPGDAKVSNPTGTLSDGELVGNYKVLGLLGAGGMGVIYRAFDMKLERTVALKFLPEDLVSSAEDRKRALREARAASSLDHPNIGVVHGFEETDDGRVFMVMAYYQGETLANKIHRGPLPVGEAVNLAIQIADGLSAAHAGSVIHRDIKPANVIVTERGLAKIVDFGLAQLSTNSGSTKTLGSSGTVGYMSPEQAMGKLVDQRTDIWACGVTLAEMLTGKNPFASESMTATLVAILDRPPQFLDDTPLDLRRIIYHALAKDPETRYSSCAEMLSDLQDFNAQLASAPAPALKALHGDSAASKELRLHLEHASGKTWLAASAATRRAPRWMLVAGVLLVLAAVLSLLPPVRERVAAWFAHPEEHIAVLPFDNTSNDSSMQAESQGLMDTMTDELSNLSNFKKSLWVIPASVVRSRKITDPLVAARELGATLVVRGSIQRSGQSVHLSVSLIDAKNLRQIGAASLDDSAGNIADLQNEAVSRMAQLMNINVSASTLRATGGSVAPAAYELYLKALGVMQRYDKPGNLEQAISFLGTAVQTDPRFALGYAQLGEAYRLKYSLDRNLNWLDEAQANCRKATEINHRLPSVYVTLARIHQLSGKYDLALQEFQQALDLNPRSPEALNGLAKAYEHAGRLQEAEAEFIRSAALRPDYWDGYDELGIFYDRQSRFPEAVEQLKHAAALSPDNAQVYSNLGAVYIDWGDPKVLPEAEQALKKSIALSPSYAAYANLAELYTTQKRYSESAALWEQALQLNDRDYRVWGYYMNTLTWLKDDAKVAVARHRKFLLLRDYLKVAPQDGPAQAELASLYARMKQYDKAKATIQTALALSPNDASALHSIGVAYEVMGNRALALQYVEKSLQKGTSLDSIKLDADLANLVNDPRFRATGK
jgi:eukaryotic-like serine/threonine-protein kinase